MKQCSVAVKMSALAFASIKHFSMMFFFLRACLRWLPTVLTISTPEEG